MKEKVARIDEMFCKRFYVLVFEFLMLKAFVTWSGSPLMILCFRALLDEPEAPIKTKV